LRRIISSNSRVLEVFCVNNQNRAAFPKVYPISKLKLTTHTTHPSLNRLEHPDDKRFGYDFSVVGKQPQNANILFAFKAALRHLPRPLARRRAR